MTLNELKNDVARLGFESYVEDEECFIASANRALSLIYVDRPVSKVACITFGGPRVSCVREFIEHVSGEEITVPVKGKSLSFRSHGKGTCTISDSSGSSSVFLTQEGQLTKQFIYGGEATLTFSGDYYFTVTNLAVFLDLTSDKAVDIPEYGPYLELAPEDYCDGFRSFAGYPTDSSGKRIEEVKLMDGRILAPFGYRGELYLTYYRTPKVIKKDTAYAIDVSDECAPMLPLLTASFLWLDDDAAKAQYYMSLYRDMIANVRRYSNNRIDTAYSTEGWA
jgi:hypothetical protein